MAVTNHQATHPREVLEVLEVRTVSTLASLALLVAHRTNRRATRRVQVSMPLLPVVPVVLASKPHHSNHQHRQVVLASKVHQSAKPLVTHQKPTLPGPDTEPMSEVQVSTLTRTHKSSDDKLQAVSKPTHKTSKFASFNHPPSHPQA